MNGESAASQAPADQGKTASNRAESIAGFLPRTGNGPLSGQLVVDFSRVLAGPYSTMMLADLGATVIKVEGPGGDDTRNWSPPVRDEDATYYLSINRNKFDIVLDFSDAEDLTVAQKLAARADIVVENFKPGGLKKFGLDYDSVKDTNAEVIYASVTGFGAHNPLPGYDLLVQAMSGFMSVTGSPDGSPIVPASRSSTSSPVCTRRSGSWQRFSTKISPARDSWSKPTSCPRRCRAWRTSPEPMPPQV